MQSRTTAVAADGSFSFELPDAERLCAPIELEVVEPSGDLVAFRTPDGETTTRLTLNNDSLGSVLELEIAPRPAFVVAPHPDANMGRATRLTGRVIDATGLSKGAGLQVVLFGRKVIEEVDDSKPVDPVEDPDGEAVVGKEAASEAVGDTQGNGAGDEFEVVLVAVTDSNGYFSGAYPAGKFAAAFGRITGHGEPLVVPLEGDAYPRKVALYTPLEATADPDCGCGHAGLTIPEMSDLVERPEDFSSDLVPGRCIDLSVPNRAIEEFGYCQIVRTTEPEIRGITLQPPQPLPKELVTLIKDLVFDQFLFNREAPESEGPEDEAEEVVKRGSVASRAQLLSVMGDVRLPRPSVGSRLPTEAIKKGIAELDSRFADNSLRFRPEDLLKLAEDPDQFTPQELMRADRRSAFEYLKELLEALRHNAPARAELNWDNEVDWDDTPTFYQAATIAHGHILNYRQVWRAAGYSLGDLLHSVPLAPCQKKRIAVLDWERRELAAQEEELTEEESLAANLRRDRDISELARSALGEWTEGWSKSSSRGAGGGFGGAALGDGWALVVGFGGGGGGSSAESWQSSSRQLGANSRQRVRDRLMRSATSMRSQRATVVRTVAQGEQVRAQTEVIANHNHCHAMTVHHFEVLRHLIVTDELTDVQECLFIPLLMSPFDRAKIVRWGEPLRRFLRDSRLERAFAAVERRQMQYYGSDVPPGMYADEQLEEVDGSLRLLIEIARPREQKEDEELVEYFDDAWKDVSDLLGDPSRIYREHLQDQADRDRAYDQNVAPRLARAYVDAIKVYLVDARGGEHAVPIDATLVNDYERGKSHYIRLSAAGGVPAISRAAVVGIRIRTLRSLPMHSRVIVQQAHLRYRTAHLRHRLYINKRVNDDLLAGDDVYLTTPLDRAEMRNPKREDAELERRLVEHLNAHLEYYHRVLWMTMDPERRFLLLDGFEAPGADGRSVASVVENRLIGIAGNSLVMPVARGFQLDPRYKLMLDEEGEQAVTSLLDLYAPEGPAPPQRISLPTRGVYAEAVLGKCNSCEVKDESRFWRWEEEPCPDEPTAIDPLGTESRRVATSSLAPQPFAQPLINVQNAPELPNPVGLDQLLRLIATPNMFRDVTGLSETQRNALAAFQQALGTGQSFAAGAMSLLRMQQSQGQADRALGHIEDAHADEMITDQTRNELTEQVLRNMVGDIGKGQKATQKEVIETLLNDAAAREKSEVTVKRSSPDGKSETITIKKEPKVVEEGGAFIHYKVPGIIEAIQQPNQNACWAAVATMMVSWRRKQSLAIDDVLAIAGEQFELKYKDEEALSSVDKPGFLKSLDLTGEPQMSWSVRGVLELLQEFGPLWVTTVDEAASGKFSAHAWIIEEIVGTGAPSQTHLSVINPADGNRESPPPSFDKFMRMLEDVGAKVDAVQVVHF